MFLYCAQIILISSLLEQESLIFLNKIISGCSGSQISQQLRMQIYRNFKWPRSQRRRTSRRHSRSGSAKSEKAKTLFLKKK